MKSDQLQAVSRLPQDATIFTNGPDAVGYFLKHPVRYVPVRTAPRIGVEDPEHPYQKQLDELSSALAAGNSYVVFLDGITWRSYLGKEHELVERFHLQKMSDLRGGRIYSAPAPQDAQGAASE